ncbi:MAG: TldD/PmbA family protein [Nitrososphaeria archaeon]|nr:TldD/PmbA family protein [Nitrososphaeria archaeon]NIQ32281.1 TldD/PmbA family protein [Nitrososphaeria archaeon]
MSQEEIGLTAVDMALSLGSEYAEARFQMESTESIVFKNGEVEAVIRGIEEGVGIRVLINGALGFSSTNLISEASIGKAAQTAVKTAKAASDRISEPIKLEHSETFSIFYTAVEKYKWENIDLRDKVSLLEDTDRVLKDEREFKIKFPSRLLELEHRREEKLFVNSEGTSLTSKIPRVEALYIITGIKNGDSVQRIGHIGGSGGWEIIASKNLNELIGQEAKVLGRVLTEATKPPEKSLDVVVGGEVAGIIAHEALGHPSEADRILGREAAQAGESYMTPDSIGSKIGSEEVYVSDDPTIAGSSGFYFFDDEGVKAEKRVLVEAGEIRNFLHNRETSASLGVPSNGSARAMSYSVEPIIRMANTYFEPGDYSFEELIEDIEHGLYIKNFMEWNISDRRTNQRYTGLEAYLIEKGETTKPVRNPIIEITTKELLRKLDARGRDLNFWSATCGKGDPEQGAPVWTGGPSLRFRDIQLSTR